jgi:hypothetical protein
VVNNVGEGEYLRASPTQLMQQPYGRVIVLHITILAGGFLVTILQSPLVGLVLLVGLKIGLDLRSHLREHRRMFNSLCAKVTENTIPQFTKTQFENASKKDYL